MAEQDPAHCIHLDKPLRWFGYRQENGRKLYRFQCLGCGKSFTSIVPLPAKNATGPLDSLSGISLL